MTWKWQGGANGIIVDTKNQEKYELTVSYFFKPSLFAITAKTELRCFKWEFTRYQANFSSYIIKVPNLRISSSRIVFTPNRPFGSEYPLKLYYLWDVVYLWRWHCKCDYDGGCNSLLRQKLQMRLRLRFRLRLQLRLTLWLRLRMRVGMRLAVTVTAPTIDCDCDWLWLCCNHK